MVMIIFELDLRTKLFVEWKGNAFFQANCTLICIILKNVPYFFYIESNSMQWNLA